MNTNQTRISRHVIDFDQVGSVFLAPSGPVNFCFDPSSGDFALFYQESLGEAVSMNAYFLTYTGVCDIPDGFVLWATTFMGDHAYHLCYKV